MFRSRGASRACRVLAGRAASETVGIPYGREHGHKRTSPPPVSTTRHCGDTIHFRFFRFLIEIGTSAVNSSGKPPLEAEMERRAEVVRLR